jgi:diguanylate cyclase (GGDEF)-like protein/PAS domain S-box-containing protein
MSVILVINADDAERGAACDALAAAAHVVHGVRHVSEGACALGRRRPDLVLLAGDAQAPEHGGAPRADGPLLVRVWSVEQAGRHCESVLMAGVDTWFATPCGDGELAARVNLLLLQWRLAAAARQALMDRQLALNARRNARLPVSGARGAYLAEVGTRQSAVLDGGCAEPAGSGGGRQARLAETLRHEHLQLFRDITCGASPAEAMAALCRMGEALVPHARCAMLAADSDGQRLRHVAAPGLPAAFVAALDAAPVGTAAGSCTAALLLRRDVIACDISDDPHWAWQRETALRHGLQACWSYLITDRHGEVQGVMAWYFPVPHFPGAAESAAAASCARIAGAALVRGGAAARAARQLPSSAPRKADPGARDCDARDSAGPRRQPVEARLRDWAALLDHVRDAIIVRGSDHRISFWNKGAERLYGWTAGEALGRSMAELLHEGAAFDAATDCVLRHGEWSGEIVKRHKDGCAITVEVRCILVRHGEGRPQSLLEIGTDLTQRKLAEREIRQLAFYDPLTRLPNRALLLDRLQQALSSAEETRPVGALFFIDLDNFKTLNDTRGHDMGDMLLQQVAMRLGGCVPDGNVARLGGDEFVVMLTGLDASPGQAALQAAQAGAAILACFSESFMLDNFEHRCTPSIGATLFNDDIRSVEELLKRADLAMYQAKANGRNVMCFFDPRMQAAVTARVDMEADLRLALERGEFLLHYQPQVSERGVMMGAEALVRWRHPRRGLVSPAEFIPLAEECGLILALGDWVLQTACVQLRGWAADVRTAGLSIAVNVSARQFRHPGFVADVQRVLGETGANPRLLKLELTESLLIDNMEVTIEKMSALKSMGVGFSLDDFGTGYSSLTYLKRLPLDQLKIDQSFVQDVLIDPNDAAIARTIVALGKSLGLEVIAEGVETEAQRNFLACNGCHIYQGYLFSPAVAADLLLPFYAGGTAREG